jgi:hypothetical protein
MEEVTDTDMTITNLVDLDGVQIVKLRPLSLSDENLIPANSFDDEDPDDSNYEGYMGNVCHSHSLSESHLIAFFFHSMVAMFNIVSAGPIFSPVPF